MKPTTLRRLAAESMPPIPCEPWPFARWPHFEHKLFLTATPHNGYRESFAALLELLDNQRFARAVTRPNHWRQSWCGG